MATRRTLILGLAAASLPAAGASQLASALFGLRVSSPAVVFLATLSLLPSKRLSPPSPSPSPITSVVVRSLVPRKSLILSLLSLAALSFLVDGLAHVAYAVLNAVWRSGTGVELAALLGLIAYTALAALGAYKDVNNIEIWSRKRVKAAVFFALALDIAQVVLLVLSVKTRDPSHICDSSKLSACIPETIHFFTPLFRVVVLLPLFFVLFSPRVVYLTPQSHPDTAQVESAPLIGQSTVLLQEEGNEAVAGTESTKYGTFAHGQSPSNTITICPESESSLAILWRLGPYVWPAKGLLSLITLFHVLTRVITPLVPLSLGVASNAFLSASSSPIPAPLGTSPYPYIFLFALLHFLLSDGGIPNLTRALVSRLGSDADDALISRYTDHVLGLALGSSKSKVPEDLHSTGGGAISKVLHAVSAFAAVVDDVLIGVVVLAVLFGWEFGVAVLVALVVYGYLVCLNCRPSILSACPAKVSAFAFVEALFGSGVLLLGSLYIAKGVTEGVWSPGAWVAWVWYWGILFVPLTRTPSLRAATSDVKSIFNVLHKPAGVVDGKVTLDRTDGVEIKFDNASLTYPYTDTEEPVLAFTGVSCVIPPGSVTAVVTTSGSTRSSLLKALYRLYDVDSGSIYVNGVPVHSLSLASLRSLVTVVPDICSDGRSKAISRALAKDTKVVLVEGTMEHELVTGRTVIWEVTNGLNGIDDVDQILVLKDGKLVESGPFKELVQADGAFASLWADHTGASAPIPGSSTATVSGAAEGYDVSIINIQGQVAEVTAVDVFVSNSPHVVTASLRAPSVRAQTASIRAPSIRPTASIRADSVAPSVPTKDFSSPVTFPAAPELSEPVSFPTPSAAVAFPESSAPAPIAFPKTDDSRSIDSGSQAHVRLPTSITFETTATPPRVSTPDPSGASPDTEGKRKRISSQNFQRLARRISLSTPKKGAGIPGLPGIAGIAGVLRRDTSVKVDKGNGENGARPSTDIPGVSSSAPETARNSGEISAERTEKDKEREEKKRKRKSFMEVVGAIRGDTGAVVTPPPTEVEPQAAPGTSEA